MINQQIQIKISLSKTLNARLEAKAANLGVPATQFVKHLILKEVEEEQFPVFQASDWTEDRVKKALAQKEQAEEVTDLHEFFKDL
jgi:predicted DNA-binding protein